MDIFLIVVVILLLIINIIQFKIYKDKSILIDELESKNKKLLSKKLEDDKDIDVISIDKVSDDNPAIKKEEPIIEVNNSYDEDKFDLEDLTKTKEFKSNNQTSPIAIKSIPECDFAPDSYINKNSRIIPNVKDKEDPILDLTGDDDIITLTDYEREEEENAIISYKELKNNNRNLTKEETKIFIENLKKLRDSLK